ncbi:MAG TPA: prepilin-type N-terminal cleavage/methylation domain-containing protein [Thermoanaerobaculia bacterium]|nr:prepilin-type N-terminal cleavage/methylation domain-containing protein [Thermoanaerobaculia bacterium]
MSIPRSSRRGFTLIEMLVVSAIIGILVSIAASNMRSVMSRARQRRTMADMRTLALGVDSFATDQNRFPAAAGYALPSGLSLPTATIGEIVPALSPTYLRTVPLLDGWNSWFTYSSDGASVNYALRSNGADGVPESSPPFGETHDFKADIILVNGSFVQFPEGVQK